LLEKLSYGEHIRALLQRFQYSEQLKKTVASRIVFGGEILSQVVADLDIHNSYALRNWVSLYQRKLQTGLFIIPAMTRMKNAIWSLVTAQRRVGAGLAAG
jgi:transposase-like protein